ncbi:DUF5985 family protein [Caulobacter sp.]|uniref:DUF5985 family protein n=1 Tax=Caulobacter sp. TaxID=78 RepID=UPI003BB04782
MSGPTVVYILCMLTSAACAGLLVRAWLASRSRLLLWTAISFGFLALNNLLLVADLVIFVTQVNLLPYRQAAAGLAITSLLYGFIWEVDE